MPNLSEILKTFNKDIEELKAAKKAKDDAKSTYDSKKKELGQLKEEEIKKLSKEVALKNLEELELAQREFNDKNNQYADAVLKMQNDFEEIQSTVRHSLVDTVYDARKMMHYLTNAKDHNDSDFKNDNKSIEKYLKSYNEKIVKFDSKLLDELIKEAKSLSKSWDSNERKKLMSAFARHAEEDLKNLKTFLDKKTKLQKTLKDVNLNETVEKLPTTDEIVTNYKALIPKLFDQETGEEITIKGALDEILSKFLGKSDEKEVKFEYEFEIKIMIPLYADPIVTVSFDFKFNFKFATSAKIKAEAGVSTEGVVASVSLDASCSLTFGVGVALSLRIIQLIEASINVGIDLSTSIKAEATLKRKITSLSGETSLKAEASLIAKTWISLSICGPVSAIIKATTGKDPELRWLLGELILFKLSMEKKALLSLNIMNNELESKSNFMPLRDGFSVEFVGKDEIKRKLNERYNNKLSAIKQQFLSNDEMVKAHEDKVKLLKEFDVLDFDAGDTQNNGFKQKVNNRTNFVMKYESYFNNFVGKIIETLDPQSEKVQKTSAFVSSYATELKKEYHKLFIKANADTQDLFDGMICKEAKYEGWEKDRSSLCRVVAENNSELIEKLKNALTRVKDNQECVSKLFALEIIDLEYINTHLDIPFKEMSTLIDNSREEAEKFIEKLLIGDVGKDSCVFGFSSIEVFSSKRKQKKEARALLISYIEDYIREGKDTILKIGNLSSEISNKLTVNAEKLKEKFDQIKVEEKEKAYHQHLAKQEDPVITYFYKIASELDLEQVNLKVIEKGIDRISDFHTKNSNNSDFIYLMKDDIKAIYNGKKEFKDFVLSEIREEYNQEIGILNNLKVQIDLYDWFEKGKNQQRLKEFMSNVIELNDFIENHKDLHLEEKHWYGDKTYKDFLEKNPEEMKKELDEILKKKMA